MFVWRILSLFSQWTWFSFKLWTMKHSYTLYIQLVRDVVIWRLKSVDTKLISYIDVGFPRNQCLFFVITNSYTLHVISWKQRKWIRGEGRCKARLETILRTYILLELWVQLVGNFIFVRDFQIHITVYPFFFFFFFFFFARYCKKSIPMKDEA